MFDNIALKANLGAKVAPAASAVVGRFGPSRTPSIVSIAPTLDRVSSHTVAKYPVNVSERHLVINTRVPFDHSLLSMIATQHCRQPSTMATTTRAI